MAYKVSRLGNVLQQEYQNDPAVIMALQSMKQGSSTAPVYSPLEGVARALTGGIGGYFAGQQRRDYEGKQQEQYGAIADILAKPTTEMGPEIPGSAPLSDGSTLNYSTPNLVERENPNRAKIMAALSSGLLDPSTIGKYVAKDLGFGEQADPKDRYMNVPGVGMVDLMAEGGPKPVVRERLKGNPGDVFLDQTDTGLAPAYSIKDPNKPFDVDGNPNIGFQSYEKEKAAAGAARTSVSVNGTAGEDARDRAAGAMVSEFIDSGGYADAEKNLKQLRAASATLKSGANVTGPITGMMPDMVNAIANPTAVNTKEQVEEVVQRNLRALLGAQFTAQEGERLISRAYNPKLPEATNADRIDRLIGAMEKAYASKKAAAEYLNKNRTMRGYVGPRVWSLGDIEAAAGLDATGSKPTQGTTAPSVSNW